MPKRDQLRRLLEIDRRVRAGEYPHPDQLAVELEVTRRVVFNDRNYLINVLGAPLEFHKERRGWYYTEDNYVLPTAMMTRGELLAFVLAIEAAQRQLGPVLEKELFAAIEKISQSLEGNIEVDLESLRQHLTFAPLPTARVVSHHIQTLREAIERQKIVSMTYFSAHRRQSSSRNVEPHHLVQASGDWYFYAFDRKKRENGEDGKMLTFSVGRIEALKILNEGFARQDDFSPSDFLKSGFRTESGPKLYEVLIHFDAAQAPYIRERQIHVTQRLEELEGGELALHFKSSGLGELTRYVLQFGPRAKVISPPELREAVRTQVLELARQFENDN
jgi:predicted DNA-binding transcriptional regulator YafY